MLVTHAFTWSAAIAVVLLLIVLGIVLRRRAAYIKSGRNGAGRKAANFLVRVVSVRLLTATLLMLAGAGVLVGHRQTAFLIAVVPLVYLLATAWDLRDLA